MQTLQLAQKDFDSLEMFIERAEEMSKQSSYFHQYKDRSMHIGGDSKGTSARLGENAPTEESLFAIANRLRPFYMEKEQVSYLAINSKLRRLCVKAGKQEWAALLENHRKGYLDTLKHSLVGITFRGKTLTPREVLGLFLYGKYSHNYSDQHKMLKELGDLLPIVKFFLMHILDNLCQCILLTANVYFHLRKDFQLVIAVEKPSGN